MKRFDIKDGMGISLSGPQGRWPWSAGGTPRPRAEGQGVGHILFNGVEEKLPVLKTLMEELGLNPEEVATWGRRERRSASGLRDPGCALRRLPRRRSPPPYVTATPVGTERCGRPGLILRRNGREPVTGGRLFGLLDSYVLKEPFLLFGVTAFTMVFVAGDLFEAASLLIEKKSFGVVWLFLYRLPQVVTLTCPCRACSRRC